MSHKLEKKTERPKYSVNLKLCNIGSMICNFAGTIDIKLTTLANCWKKLLISEDVEPEKNEYEIEKLYKDLQQGVEDVKR